MRILVADDEASIRDILLQRLLSLGYEVQAARDGLEALALVEQFHPQIVILDVTMPGLDGYGVLERIRSIEKQAHIYILMLTAHSELEDIERGLQSGADDYLAKPFQLRELVARVNAAVRVQSLQEHLVTSNDRLAEANRALESSLKAQETLNREMTQQMEMAARLQDSLLSPGSLELGACRIGARYRPSSKIGGDFYDLRQIDDARAGLFLADAVGHGVSAALLAAMLKVALDEALARETVPSRILNALNRAFQFCSDKGKYLTAFSGLLDCRTGRLTYALAGHVPPLLYRASGTGVEKLDGPGVCLGIFEDGDYADREIRLNPGDRLLVFTDGIYEASTDDVLLFGSRLPSLLEEGATAENRTFFDLLDRRLGSFLGATPRADDYTLLSVQFGSLAEESAGA